MGEGSIEEVVRRLAVWAEGTPQGIALVRYDSEPARRAATDRLIGALEERGMAIVVRELAPVSPAERVEALAQSLQEAPPHSVLVASGFAETPGNEAEARDRLGPWNFARERLAVHSIVQVWWLPRSVADALARTAPDLYSWILLRLDLSESLPSPSSFTEEVPIRFGDADMARATAARLEERFRRLPESERKGAVGIDAVLRMVDALDKAGLFAEATGMLIRITAQEGYFDTDTWIDSIEIEDQTQKATWLSRLASHDRERGDYEKAKVHLEAAYKINLRLLGDEAWATSQNLHNMAWLLQKDGRLEEARQIFERLLSSRRDSLGKDHPASIRTANNLAAALKSEGRLEDARLIYKESLEIAQSALGEHHTDTLTSMHGLAGILILLGRLEEGKELCQRALNDSRAIHGEHHPKTLMCINLYATSLLREGKTQDARPIFDELLTSARTILGNQHPDTLTAMSNLAWCLLEEGDTTQAVRLVEEALDTSRETLGPQHPKTKTYERHLLEANQRLNFNTF